MQAYTTYDAGTVDLEPFNAFKDAKVHKAMATCSSMRPAVDISVGIEGSDEGVGAGAARTEYRSAVSA